MLTQTLRAMERDGLVGRRVHAEVPPRVEYALTPLGATLAPPLKALGSWSLAHGKRVEEARERFDERLRGRSARPSGSAEQVLRRRADERGRARPVVGDDVALEPAHAAPPARASPCARTRSAAAAASSAIAITVACSSRPVGVRPPAPVLQRREAGAADRDLALARGARRGRTSR